MKKQRTLVLASILSIMAFTTLQAQCPMAGGAAEEWKAGKGCGAKASCGDKGTRCDKAEGDTACAGKACKAKYKTASDGHKSAKAEITTSALATLLSAQTPLVLLDARSGKYDDGRRIPGAESLNANSTPEEIASAVPDKGALVVTYCSNLKCPASSKLAEHLRSLGYDNVLEYPWGIEGWVHDGNSVVTAQPNQ